MKKTNIAAIAEIEQKSPSGKFHSLARNISLELGGVRGVGTWGGGHPFDLQIRRLPPGAAVCPFHLHLAQWEMFMVLRGRGLVRTSEARTEVKPGEVFFHPPGEAHQITNTGADDLEILIIADNPPLDGCYYPDSKKWALRPPAKVFRMEETDYFDGEDPAPPGASTFQPPPPQPAPASVPFARRKLDPEALAWEELASPKGGFRGAAKELSIALGAKNAPTGLGGHPFDLELQKLPPGMAGCPFHFHAAQWELYYILGGTAAMRMEKETHSLGVGEVIIHPPGEAHQIRNASATEDLLVLVVADNPPVDYWHYPDSNKWGIRTPRKFFRLAEVDYWDGEDPPGAHASRGGANED